MGERGIQGGWEPSLALETARLDGTSRVGEEIQQVEKIRFGAAKRLVRVDDGRSGCGTDHKGLLE